jgi:hypothetical protein
VSPFVLFRRWATSGPAAERLASAVAILVSLAMLGWAMVPGDDATEVSTTSGDVAAATGAATATATSLAGGAGTAGATAGVAPGSTGPTAVAAVDPAAIGGDGSGSTPGDPTAPGAGAGCDNTATDVGVSADEILIGVILYDLGSLNSGLGLDPADQQITFTNALFDAVNAQGGVQCRNIVPRYYRDNVLDSAGEHAACLQMVQDGVFAVLNNLFTPAETTCVARQGIPNIWATPIHNTDVAALAPFVLSPRSDFDTLIRNYIFGLQQYGFYDGVERLGILIDSCYSDITDAAFAALAQLGVTRDQMSVYDYGCPNGVTPPNLHFAAALQMKRDGVTHVLNTAYGAISGFASAAADQGYEPRYGLMDDNAAVLLQTANPPADPSLDGALFVTADQTGAENTAGATFTPATDRCVALAAGAGIGSPLEPGRTAAPLRGLQCALVDLFVAIAQQTRPLVRTGLAPVMGTLGPVDLAFPAGQNDLRNPALPAGGQFWRVTRYDDDCTCVRLVDGVWHPSFG